MERTIFKYDQEMIWPEEEDYNIKEDSENRKTGTELQSELNQIEENEIEEREEEGKNIFDVFKLEK